MAQIQKPDSLNKIWSSAGDNSLPTDQKIREGWAVEIPPREWFNWLDNRQDQAIAHINQHGIAVWDGMTEYQANKSYTQDPDDGIVYRCIATNSGSKPSTSPAFWKKAFLDEGDPLILNAVQNTRRIISGTGLSGGGDLSADRTLTVNFGTTAGTVTQGNDSRLSNAREWSADTVTQAEAEAGTATTRRAWTAQRVRQAIVAWFNGTTTALTRTILGRSNASQIRSDLQLGTAAIRDVTVTHMDDNPSKVLKPGDFGLGAINAAGSEVSQIPTHSGWFRFSADADIPQPPMRKDRLAVLCAPFSGGHNQISLMAFNYTSNNVFIYNTVEEEWVELYHTGNTIPDPNGILHNGTSIPSGKESVTEDSAFAVGQTWQQMRTSRSINTTYTNTTGKAIMVSVELAVDQRTLDGNDINEFRAAILVDNKYVFYNTEKLMVDNRQLNRKSVVTVVPAGSTYRVWGDFLGVGGLPTIQNWHELR